MSELAKVSKVIKSMTEVHQPRSDYQLRNFVVGQHATIEMQYVQTVTEIQALYFTIAEVDLQVQKTEIEINRLRATGDEINEIEAKIKELGLEQTRIVATGALRELNTLLEIYESFGTQYTRLEIELGQEEYWQKRLNTPEYQKELK